MTNGQANQEMVDLMERLQRREHYFRNALEGEYDANLLQKARFAIETLLKQQEEMLALISEESIEHMAQDIACAIINPRRDVVAMRHSAMVRLGERLRNPYPIDLRRASLTKPTLEDEHNG